MQNGKTGGDSPQTPQPIEIPAAKIPTFIAGGGTTVDKEVTDLQIGETEKNLASAIPQQPLTETAPQSTSGSDMPIQASGTEGLFTDRTTLSQQATSSLQEAAAANAPPELTYASEEEGLAAHQPPRNGASARPIRRNCRGSKTNWSNSAGTKLQRPPKRM